MNAASVQHVADRDFSARVQVSDEQITAHLTGNADLRSKHSLDAFITSLHAEVGRVGAPEVTVDLRELQFMNSSCFKCVVSWIVAMQEMPIDRRYKIAFISNPTLHWQRRSLQALCSLGADLVSVHT